MNNSFQVYDLLLIDIETVPQAVDFSELSPENQLLFAGKISKTMPETITPEESYKMRAGILAEFGKIICISTAYFYRDENNRPCLKMKSIYGDDEKELLTNFLQLLEKFQKHNSGFVFAGHNVKEFDIPYICRRLLINQLSLPGCLQIHGAKPWEIRMLDTLQWWRFGDYKHYTSLHLLASVLGIPTSKTDMDGSMVQDVYYKDKDLQRIVEYCQRDVVVVANIVLRFNQLELLKEDQVTVV